MKRIIIILMMMLMAGEVLGATHYVEQVAGNGVCYATAGWPSDNAGTRTCNSNITTAAAVAGNLLTILAAGTYTNADLAPDHNYAHPGRNSQVIRGAISTDGASNKSGAVILSGDHATYGALTTLTYTGITFSNLSITSAGAADFALYLWGEGWTLNDVTIYNSVESAVYFRAGGTANRLNIYGTAAGKITLEWDGTTGSNVTINYSKIYDNGAGAYARLNGPNTKTMKINNSLFYGHSGYVLYPTASNGQAIVINNSIFFNNASSAGNQAVVSNPLSVSVTINNSITLSNPVGNLALATAYQNTTLNSGISTLSPKFVSQKYPAIVTIGIDDRVNLSDMQALATKLEARGLRGTFAVNSNDLSDFSPYLTLQAAGHAISDHGAGTADLCAQADATITAEATASKAALIAGGLDISTYILHSVGTVDTDCQNLLKAVGYTGGRGATGETGASYLLSSAIPYNIVSWDAYVHYAGSSQATTVATVKQNVIADMERLKQIGGIHTIFAHSTSSDLTSDQWDAVLDAIQDSGITVMTLPAAVAYIRVNGTLQGDGLTYTRTLTDASDYRLQWNSPAKNAGVLVTGVHDVAGVVDYAGNSVYNRNGIDIGAYEYMENQTLGSGPAVTVGAGPAITLN